MFIFEPVENKYKVSVECNDEAKILVSPDSNWEAESKDSNHQDICDTVEYHHHINQCLFLQIKCQEGSKHFGRYWTLSYSIKDYISMLWKGNDWYAQISYWYAF